jgi:hypothetical protein
MRAKLPASEGFVERDGVKLHYEVYGQGAETMVFLPPWSIVHSRVYKAQLPYFSERFRCIAFDGRGNGKSDRPADVAAYSLENCIADILAVPLPNQLRLARVRVDAWESANLPDRQPKEDGPPQDKIAALRKDDGPLPHAECLLGCHADFRNFAVRLERHAAHLADLESLGGLHSAADQLGRVRFFQHGRLFFHHRRLRQHRS